MKSKRHSACDGVAFIAQCSRNVRVLILEAETWVSSSGSSTYWMGFYFLTSEMGVIIPCLQRSQNWIRSFQHFPKFLLYGKVYCGQVGLGNTALKGSIFLYCRISQNRYDACIHQEISFSWTWKSQSNTWKETVFNSITNQVAPWGAQPGCDAWSGHSFQTPAVCSWLGLQKHATEFQGHWGSHLVQGCAEDGGSFSVIWQNL